MTVDDLVRAAAGYDLAATPAGDAIEYDDDTPDALEQALVVLRSGVLAKLTGRNWLGCHGLTGRIEGLAFDALVPERVTLLAVAGGGVWDRVHAAARRDLPHLFAGPPPPPEPPRRVVPFTPNRPAGPTELLLDHLRREAAAGDAESARVAADLEAYLAECDAGRVELADTPATAFVRDWNAAVDELERQRTMTQAARTPARRRAAYTDPAPEEVTLCPA